MTVVLSGSTMVITDELDVRVNYADDGGENARAENGQNKAIFGS